MDKQMEALLCAYYHAGYEAPKVVTVEDLERRYPSVDPRTIASVGARLEQAGFIRPVSNGGHVITEAGRAAYLAEC
jgi:predicted transcriptional regulator of viral defense system